MKLPQVFSIRHGPIYDYYLKFFYETLSEEQLRKRPNDLVNPVIWCLWHVARTEDIGVNRLVMARGQVADEGHWLERMNVPFRHFGIGMTSKEVTDLGKAIDIHALGEYHQAVGRRIKEAVEGEHEIDLDRVLEDGYLYQVLGDEGAVRSAELSNVFNSYQGMSRVGF